MPALVSRDKEANHTTFYSVELTLALKSVEQFRRILAGCRDGVLD